MAKVKIIKSPKLNPNAGTGRTRPGDQVGFSLYNNQVHHINEPDYKPVPGAEDVRSLYPEVPREEANVEVERGEVVVSPDLGTIYNVGGKKHSKGGTPIKAKEGSYIISDFVQINQPLMDMLGLDYDEKKDSGKTWAKVAKQQVDPKYFNQLTAIMSDKEKRKPVDPYAYNAAKIKLPELQATVSKIALGNELSKAMSGKEYNIPNIAQIALQSLQTQVPDESDGPMLEAKMGGSLPRTLPTHLPMAQSGGQKPGRHGRRDVDESGNTFVYDQAKNSWVPDSDWLSRYNPDGSRQYKSDPLGMNPYFNSLIDKGDVIPYAPNNIQPWMGDKNENKGNWSRYTAKDIRDKAMAVGYSGPMDNISIQNWLYNNPNTKPVVDRLHSDLPPTPNGGVLDGKWGYRWDMILDQLNNPPQYRNHPAGEIQTVRNKVPGLPSVPNKKLPVPAAGAKGALQFDNGTGKNEIGYDWHNIRNVVDSMHQDPTYYPWSAKMNAITVDPQMDDPNYYPLLSANATRQNGINQISNPSIARAVGSYNPDLMMGLIQETQRARGNNLQSKQQAAMFNAQVLNQAGAQEAGRQTQDYNNTIKTLDNRNESRNLRRENINRSVDNADFMRDQMRYMLAQNPQYTVRDRNNYSSAVMFDNNGKSLANSANQGPNPFDQFKSIQNAFTGYTPEQHIALYRALFNGKEDYTETFKKPGQQAVVKSRNYAGND